MKLRISERRLWLITVRRAIWRAALRAEGVLGMAVLVLRAAGWPAPRRAAGYRKEANGGERLAANTPLIVAAPESVNGGQGGVVGQFDRT